MSAAPGLRRNERLSVLPLLYAGFLLVPIYWLVLMSFKTDDEIKGPVTFWPAEPTVNNYLFIFSDPDWTAGFANALIYVLLNVVLVLAVAVPAAYAFSRFRFFGDRLLFFMFLAFRMTAPAILLVPFVQVFAELGLIDTHFGVALAHCAFNVPIAVWILEGFISGIPIEMDESARADGYGPIQFMVRILLPQIAAGIAVTAFFCFMFSWVELLMANALTTVDAKPIGGVMSRVAGFLNAYLPILSAASVLTLLPGIAVIVFARRYLARGFSLGRVG